MLLERDALLDRLDALVPAGSEVYAESFRVVVTPAGRVHATSTYPAQPLDCD